MKSRDALEAIAKKILDDAGLATATPIPIEQVATHLGAVIRYQPFGGKDVSGLLFRDATGGAPVIGVNSTTAPVRQRFTIAHECAHLQLHQGQQLILDRLVRVNFRDATSSTATDDQEIEANAVAAALLMPAELIQDHLSRGLAEPQVRDQELVLRLARTFEVSRQAMEYRLINLGLFMPG